MVSAHGFAPVQMEGDALRFASAAGFISLEMEEEPLDGAALPKKKKAKKAKKEATAKEGPAAEPEGRGLPPWLRPADEAYGAEGAAPSAEPEAAAPSGGAADEPVRGKPKAEVSKKRLRLDAMLEKRAAAKAAKRAAAGAPPAPPQPLAAAAPKAKAKKYRKTEAERSAANEARAAAAAEAATAAEEEEAEAETAPAEPKAAPAASKAKAEPRRAKRARLAAEKAGLVAPIDPTLAGAEGWASFGLHAELLAKLAQAGFSQPTPIQRECLPPALHGYRDLIAAAETGSGKTLAFGLPILQRLLERRDDGVLEAAAGGLYALIVAPTRELAAQVAAHIGAVAPDGVHVVPIVGGMSIEKQRRQLGQRPQIVVGTPGRLWELISDASCSHLRSLESLRFFVMDEVDRMVEAGHFKELESILRVIDQTTAGGSAPVLADGDAASLVAPTGAAPAAGEAEARQTFLFSATLMLPPNAREANAKRLKLHKPTATDSTVDKLLRMLRFRHEMKIVDLSREQLVAQGLNQASISCTVDEKDAFLFLLLRTRAGRSIVFTNAITALQRLKSLLTLLGVPVLALQGNMQQRARLKALDRFRAQPGCVLLATDVAARGLDIAGVDFVVHYQLPRSAEVYVHRSGRTARGAGAVGLSVALVEPADQKAYRRLCNELGEPAGLAELPIDTPMLPRVREVVSLARQLDKAAHIVARDGANKTYRKQLAADMDLPTDSEADDDSDDGGGASSQREDAEARRKRLREESQSRTQREGLKKLLARLDRPFGQSVTEIARSGKKWGTTVEQPEPAE